MRDFGYYEEGYSRSMNDRRLWQRIIVYLRPFSLPFSGAVLLSLVVTFSALALPWLMQQAIDLYITDASLDYHKRVSGLTNTSLFYLALLMVHFAASFCQVLLLEWIGQSIMNRIRQDMFSHLLRLDLAFFNRQPVGRLVTRLTNDVQNMHEMFTSVMVTIFNDLLRMFCILALLVYMNMRLGLIQTLFVPAAALITYFFAKLARECFRGIRRQLARLNSFLQETVSGVELVQLFGRRKDMEQEFSKLNDEYLGRTLRQIRLFGTFMPLTELMGSVAIALILWYGGGEILQNQLTLGELVAFLSYMRLFFQPLRELSQKYSIVQSALASAERIFHLLEDKNVEKQPQQECAQVSKERLAGDLCFENVSFSYQKDSPVLHNVSFTVKQGETVAIVGPTGSGKSTLINLLMRFYEPEAGSITLAGCPLSTISREKLRREVGVVLQEMLILQDTLEKNIILDAEGDSEKVKALLQRAQLEWFSKRLPNGLQTVLGEGGHPMSTGEKQLLAIARLLYRKPSVLVLDEASSAVDSRTEKQLEKTLESGFNDKTVLIVAHRLSTVQRADRIIVLQKGRVVEQGSHKELLAAKGMYSRLVALDFAT